MKTIILRYVFPALLASAMWAPSAPASTLSFTGNLRTNATVTSCGSGCTLGPANSNGDYAQYAAVVDSFTLAATSTVQVVTFSYGGGVNGAGTTIAQSGLEPYLSLFDSAGNFIASTYYGTTCPAGTKTNTMLGGCYDVLLNAGTLAGGTYQIALSADENMSLAENNGTGTLANGFTGLGNLYPGEDLHYAFDVNITAGGVIPPTPTPIPEPATDVLVGSALAALATFKRYRALPRNALTVPGRCSMVRVAEHAPEIRF